MRKILVAFITGLILVACRSNDDKTNTTNDTSDILPVKIDYGRGNYTFEYDGKKIIKSVTSYGEKTDISIFKYTGNYITEIQYDDGKMIFKYDTEGNLISETSVYKEGTHTSYYALKDSEVIVKDENGKIEKVLTLDGQKRVIKRTYGDSGSDYLSYDKSNPIIKNIIGLDKLLPYGVLFRDSFMYGVATEISGSGGLKYTYTTNSKNFPVKVTAESKNDPEIDIISIEYNK